MQVSSIHTASVRKNAWAITVILFASTLILVWSGQSILGQDKQPAEEGGLLVPVTEFLPSGVKIAAGWSDVDATPYNAWARMGLAKQLVIEPKMFAKSSLLHLYELESLDAENLVAVVRKTGDASTNVEHILWRSSFFVTVGTGEKTQEQYFGTPFVVEFRGSDDPELLKTQVQEVTSHLKEIAIRSLNHVAPKGSGYFTQDANVYLAAFQRVEGVKSVGMLLTYDPISIAGELN